MKTQKKIQVEMYYTLTCPNCMILKRMLEEVLPLFNDTFELKRSLATTPAGYFKTLKLGIHTVPTLLINDQIVFRQVPDKEELMATLNNYIK